MARYGSIALIAAELARNGMSPEDSWAAAAQLLYPDRDAARKKGCPRGAFLGLAQQGLIDGVSPYSGVHSMNGEYAVSAIVRLRQDPSLARSKLRLWEETPGAGKTPNEQMDVVIALWERGYVSK